MTQTDGGCLVSKRSMLQRCSPNDRSGWCLWVPHPQIAWAQVQVSACPVPPLCSVYYTNAVT